MRLIQSPGKPDSPAIRIEIVTDRFYPADYAWLRLFGNGAPAAASPEPDTPEILVRRCSDGHYLRQAGWVELPGAVPVLDLVVQEGVTDLLLGAEPFARIVPGTAVEIAVPAFDLRQTVTWPTLFGAEQDRAGEAASETCLPGHDDPLFGAEVEDAPAEGAAVVSAGGSDRSAAAAPDRGPRRRAGDRVRRKRGRSWRGTAISAREAERATPGAKDDGDAAVLPDSRTRQRRGVPLPWKITGINIVLIVGIAFLGVQMSTGGFNPFALFDDGREEMITGGAPPAATDLDAYQRAALDALTGTTAQVNGDDPLAALRQETDALVRADASAAELTAAAGRFADAGRPAVALALHELAWSRGSGEAALAIGRMSDPRFFSTASSGFTRPNAELAITWYRRALDAGTMAAVIELDDLRLALEQAAAGGDQEAANALLLFE
ncbi:MAG: hypothetical protein RLO50_12270 [Azospirillaceae bacterium]